MQAVLLAKELRAAARRPRLFALRLACVVLVGWILYDFWADLSRLSYAPSPSEYAQLGRRLFGVGAGWGLCSAGLGNAFAGGAVCVAVSLAVPSLIPTLSALGPLSALEALYGTSRPYRSAPLGTLAAYAGAVVGVGLLILLGMVRRLARPEGLGVPRA